MDNLIVNGDMVLDSNGDVELITGVQELIQRAMIRLTMKQGAFVYDQSLGSTLHNLDIHQIEDNTLLSIVRDALSPIEEITVQGVEKSVDPSRQILYLTVYLNIDGRDAILELNNTMWDS
jgi:hypothetical protein